MQTKTTCNTTSSCCLVAPPPSPLRAHYVYAPFTPPHTAGPQVKGQASIADSLRLLVEGEVLDGDNGVECPKCGLKKSDTLKRTALCAERLPRTLVLHLKRFDFDLETFRKVTFFVFV